LLTINSLYRLTIGLKIVKKIKSRIKVVIDAAVY
jgi:hypothetical protein